MLILATTTTLQGGNVVLSIILFLIVGMVIYGLTDPKRHALVLAIAVLIIITLAFALMFSHLSLIITT